MAQGIIIRSPIKPNFRPRGDIEAWFNDGRPFEKWPDWIRSHYVNRVLPPPDRKGYYAMRDDEGYFWRWMKADMFKQAYKRLRAARR